MNIHRDNYEAWFIDFLEGNLNAEEIDQFLDFINLNPDLKEELQAYESISIPTEQVFFKSKNQLYKRKEDHADHTIAYLEGDLSPDEQKQFEHELQKFAELRREYELFNKTRLVADQQIEYPAKKQLYRQPVLQLALKWFGAAAALVVIALAIRTLVQPELSDRANPTVQELVSENAQVTAPEGSAETEKTLQLAQVQHAQNKITDHPANPLPEQVSAVAEETVAETVGSLPKDTVQWAEVPTREARLEEQLPENRLSLAEVSPEPLETPEPVEKALTLDELLVLQAKKIGAEGLQTAQKLAQTGLEAAGEITGERLGFEKRNGRIEKINFESRLLAFSIPLKKRQ